MGAVSELEAFAYEELTRAGLFDSESDYGGMLGHAVMDLVRAHLGQGHSGFSAGMAVSIFSRLADWKPLTPLTANPAEWNEVGEMTGRPMSQSRRMSSAFSDDGLKTWYDIDERLPWWWVRRLLGPWRRRPLKAGPP